MALTADFYSVQQTTYNAIVAGTSTTQGAPGAWGLALHSYMSTYDMAGTLPKSKSLGVCNIPSGVIVLSVGWCATHSLSTAVLALGSSASTAKYRAAAVYTTVGHWDDYMIPTANTSMTAISADELVTVLNDATADLPTTGTIAFRVFVQRPR